MPTHRALLLLLTIVAALAVVSPAAAQGPTETVVVQIDGTTPFGHHMIGTIVVKRDCSTPPDYRAEAAYYGMMNGQYVTFEGGMIEHWKGNGSEEIEVLWTDIQGTVNWKPPVRNFMIVQTGPNSVTVEGIPAAVSGDLRPPCSGQSAYVVANAGQGIRRIDQLPNTSSQPSSAEPWAQLPAGIVVGALFGFVAALLLSGRRRADV